MEAIQRDGHQTQDRDEGQRDDHAAEEQTASGRSLGSTADCNGWRYAQAAHQKVGRSQGDYQAHGGLLEGLTGPERQNNQRVAEAAEDSSERLQRQVGHFVDVHSFTSTSFPPKSRSLYALDYSIFRLPRSYETLRKFEAVQQFFFQCTTVVSVLKWLPFGCA